MAEEFIVSSVTVVLEKIIAMAADRIGLMLGFYGNLKAMEGLAKHIQALLSDAETKRSENPTVSSWLRSVEVAALEAENVLDELLYESLRRQVYGNNGGTMAKKVCSFFSLSLSRHDISFRVRMSPKVRGINEKLENIKREALDIKLVVVYDSLLHRDTHVTVGAASRQTDSLPEQFVAGRDREESEIVDKLLSGSPDDSVPVCVLPIVGMGGLGKTTLAKSIYNNGKIVDHFSKRSWVCVSDKFEVTEILKGILESLKGGGKVEMSSRDAIVRGIQQEVSGKRFLFVLDDVWNDVPGLWNSLFDSLVGLSSVTGSCCVLTTRLHTTANLASTFFKPFPLGKLSDDDCWTILSRRATKGGELPEELQVHKVEVVKKCQGVPLAANAIGGLLSLQRREDWPSIVVNKVLKVNESVEGEITSILKLSYDSLPSPHIKKCFVYCSVYPKDARMGGDKLIELWMAEGFLQDDVEGRMTMEENGANYLTILLQSSLLEKEEGWYKVHDLFHDLAESISRQEQFDGEYKYLKCRHLVLGEEWFKRIWNANSTLVQIVEGNISDEMLLKYRHARVLRLCNGEMENLPNAIGKLKHARCLELSGGDGIKSLPKSLCKLYNLQTLRIDSCPLLECLPQGLSNLISLRHLHFSIWCRKIKMAPRMGRLTRLQTLGYFNVGKENGHGIEELGSMINLKGDLTIRNLELVKGEKEAGSANLLGKKNLIELRLEWGSTVRNSCDDEHVLEGLAPSLTLQRLTINNFMGMRLPPWLGKLSTLVDLELKDCENCTELVRLDDGGGGAFPKLVRLRIENCCQLSSAPASFPVLERLEIRKKVQGSVVKDIVGKSSNSLRALHLWKMEGLTSLSEVIENKHNSSFKHLQIFGCHDLTDIPSSALECFPHLEEFRVMWCPNLLSCPLSLERTPSLSTLIFSLCPKLFTTDAMPRGFSHLTNLKVLYIGPFSDDSIQLFDWSGLVQGCSTTLQTLWLNGSLLENSLLPQQLQHFSSLVHLTLIGFKSVECLPDWFANFTSLQELALSDFPKLQHFPSTHAMERLSNLQRLEIGNCPLLTESPNLPNLEVV